MPTGIYKIYKPITDPLPPQSEKPGLAHLPFDYEDTDASDNEESSWDNRLKSTQADSVLASYEKPYEEWRWNELTTRSFRGYSSFKGAVNEVGFVEFLLEKEYQRSGLDRIKVFHRFCNGQKRIDLGDGKSYALDG